MRVTIEKRSKFNPKWNGNLNLPEDEQVIVHYDNLPWTERRKYQRSTDPKITVRNWDKKTDREIDRDVDDQLNTAEITVTTDHEGMTKAAHVKIDNLADQEGNPIDTWDKLCAAPDTTELKFSDLIREIRDEVSQAQKEPDSKN